MVRCFPSLVGNRKLAKQLADEIQSHRFPHAYILSGPKGSGKHTLALQIAAALACGSAHTLPCGICESCQKILGGFSPDVLFFKKEDGKSEFPVDTVRQIKSGLYIAPNELEKRVYIIEDAEDMNLNAQNAFLKMLEEPPAYVVFLLLCAHPENLLATIKSRAPLLQMESLPQETVREYLLAHSTKAKQLGSASQAELEAILTVANGSIGRALAACEDNAAYMEIRMTVLGFLDAATSPSLSELSGYLDAFPTDSATLSDFFLSLKTALRDLIVYKQAEEPHFLFFFSPEDVDQYAACLTTEKLLLLCDAIGKSEEKLQFNIQSRLCAAAFCADARKILSK